MSCGPLNSRDSRKIAIGVSLKDTAKALAIESSWQVAGDDRAAIGGALQLP